MASRETVSDEIQKNFTSHEHVSMGCSCGQSDISSYAISTMDTLLDDEDLYVSDPSLLDEVKEALIKHADGMFLWAAFQLREICSKANDEEIRNAISSENFPKHLTDIVNRALSRIVSSGKEEFVLKLLP
ncbi:NACHT domain-containing protein [Fusarium sp. Ph1]|nr:NACHT domain-containing protein [Fusarium sp. Ph1]